ncbi:MAG: hypothetical protein U5K75_12120 [Ahrensia sp.]|nr:hypothetical protein [Ahrensia sp.]
MAETDLELARARAVAMQRLVRSRSQPATGSHAANLATLSQMSQNPTVQSQPTERTFRQVVGDNVFGYDDGVESYGETASAALNTAGNL